MIRSSDGCDHFQSENIIYALDLYVLLSVSVCPAVLPYWNENQQDIVPLLLANSYRDSWLGGMCVLHSFTQRCIKLQVFHLLT